MNVAPMPALDPLGTLAAVIAGRAEEFDQQQSIPKDVISAIAGLGWLGAQVPENLGGTTLTRQQLGDVCAAMGGQSASLLSLMTVHSMTCAALTRWGNKAVASDWLPKLACGEAIGAFALSEAGAGSDAQAINTLAQQQDDTLVLNGNKRWISFAQRANVFIVTARLDDSPVTVLVPRDTPGLSVTPIQNMYGFRAAMLGEVHLQDCQVPGTHLIGNRDFGLAQVVGSILHLGRFCIAWGAVGFANACLDATAAYVCQREQSGMAIGEHQLVQRQIADMHVQTLASRLMCEHASEHYETADPKMIMSVMGAKYHSANTAKEVARKALELHGASGFTQDCPVQRHLRDAQAISLIEGSPEILQQQIGHNTIFGS